MDSREGVEGGGGGMLIGCDSDLVVLRHVGSYSPLRNGT